jgi:hypothetical protein
MKKISLILILLITSLGISAQEEKINSVLQAFPFRQPGDVTSILKEMEQWDYDNWRRLIICLDEEKKTIAASYALSAYVNHAALRTDLKVSTAKVLSGSLNDVNTIAGKRFLLKQVGLLGDPISIKAIKSYLRDAALCSDAALSIATIGGTEANKILEKALKSAGDKERPFIQAALQFLYSPAPAPAKKNSSNENNADHPTQQLLQLQDLMDKATNAIEQKKILATAGRLKGIGALAFTGRFLQQPSLETFTAPIVIRQVLADPALTGPFVQEMLIAARKSLRGEDSALLMQLSAEKINEKTGATGYVALFNGKDLTGWKGLVGNPISRSKMSADQLSMAQNKANEEMRKGWTVKDGLLIFTGHGDNLATEKKYRNFEMYVDWKITEKGDAGIYLRGSPQVQIWDTSRREVGAQVGSGGLYNNMVHPSKPTLVADNKIGDWNTFRIIMRGDKVTVYLNGKKVTDEVILENYWDRKQPIFPEEQIELQAHGTYVAYRNIFLRELPDETDLTDPREQAAGFYPLFNGKDLTGWIGNLTGYQAEDGMIVVHPEKSSGNLYTENTYSDFILRFDFQLTPGANNGIGIRAPLGGDAAYVGMEIQVLDNEHPKYAQLQPYQYHGSVYGVIPAKRGYLLPTGQWNTEEISLRGNEIKVTLNGTVITEGNLAEVSKNGTMDHKEHPGLLRKEGHIGFLGHGDVVRFKNIRIKKW